MQDLSKKRVVLTVIIISVLLVLFVVAIIFGLARSAGKNQFGGYINIQNYDKLIKHLSSDMKDSIQTSLYTTVKTNSATGFDPYSIKDAYIRASSDTQAYDSSDLTYNGTFIVDMASIKQSYEVQYSYSTSQNLDTGGSPVVISCLSTKDLMYGSFNCASAVPDQTTPNDLLLQYLPYSQFSFSITPNETAADGHLVLDVDLTIPDIDLSGDAVSRAQTVSLYKKEVTDWISSKGVDPTKYTIKYNYDDTGKYLGTTVPTN